MNYVRSLGGAAVIGAVFLPTTALADSLAPGAPSDAFAFSDFVAHSAAFSLTQLTDFRWMPDGRLVLVRKSGQVDIRRADGTLTEAGVLPVATTSEQGLLGVEVHPDFSSNHTLFFYYSRSSALTVDPGTDLDRHRVVAIVLGADDKLDMATEKILLRGLRGQLNHDGGALAIAPDRVTLYVGVGDTGCASGLPPGGTITNYFGTCLGNANGKVLRIRFDGSIPADNPLVGVASATACGTGIACAAESIDPLSVPLAAPRSEVWAWGFRNPFRFWVDPVTGNLWVGDVGETTWEEVTIAKKGRHHGWPYREGAAGNPATKCRAIVPDTGDCVDPVYSCGHCDATSGPDCACESITGGQIVDSCDWPTAFRGLYFFADSTNDQIWTVQPDSARSGVMAGSRQAFGTVSNAPVALRTGPDRALYVLSYLGGRLVRFAPRVSGICATDAGVDGGEVGFDVGTDVAADTERDVMADAEREVGSDTSGDVDSDDAGAADAVADGSIAPGVDDQTGCGCRFRATTSFSHGGVVVALWTLLVALRRRHATAGNDRRSRCRWPAAS